MQKTILILAGSPYQVPLIERAKQQGHYVITCDYLPENPGHKISDEYHNVSTTDKEAVLRLARDRDVDGVATISSDPAIPTVAHVAEVLELPGPSVESVSILTEKDRFRSVLARIGVNVPKYYVLESDAEADGAIGDIKRYVVKPIDSCGSKGVTFCDNQPDRISSAVRAALAHSRSKRCIVEEYIDGHQIHGDGYVEDGKLVYSYLGDHVFYTRTDNFIPVSTKWPCGVSESVLEEVKQQVEAIVSAAQYRYGPVNIEARVTSEGQVFIVEVGPRNGGNFVPIIQHHLTGFDFVDRIIAGALDLPYADQTANRKQSIGAHYIIHADQPGKFGGIAVSADAQRHVFYHSVFKRKGDRVDRFTGSNTTVGVFLLQFDSIAERDNLIDAAESHFRLQLT